MRRAGEVVLNEAAERMTGYRQAGAASIRNAKIVFMGGNGQLFGWRKRGGFCGLIVRELGHCAQPDCSLEQCSQHD